MYPTGRSVQETLFAQMAQAIAGNLHDVGVDTELIGADWATFLAAINVPEDKGTAHMHLFNWAPALLDASQQMTQFVRSQWPPAGWPPAITGIPRSSCWCPRRRAKPTTSSGRTSTPKRSASCGTTRRGCSCGRRVPAGALGHECRA